MELQDAKVGLKSNAVKTKLMRIGTKRDDGVSVVGGRIEEVDEFTYLGSIVSKKGSPNGDIQVRIGKARQAFRRGSRILKWGVNFCNNELEPINI